MNVLTNRIILSILFLVALFPKIEIFADNHYIAEAKKQNRRLSNQIIKIDEYIEGQNAQRLNLEIGKSVTVELPVDIEDLLTSDPKLISPIVRTSKEVVFIGKKIGQTNILFFLKGRSKPISLEIVIDQDMEGLRAAIRQLVPGVNLNVEVMNGNIVISGVAPNSDSVNIVNRLAETWVKNGKVVNLVTVKGNDQVQLKVRVVEMQRSLAKQLGLDLAGQFSNNNTNIKAGILNGFGVSGKPTSGGILSTAFNFTGKLFGSEYNLTPAIELRALERVGVIRTLAEPLITSVSGEKGEFLVGGEVPIPTGYDREQRQLIVTYKEFGVGLEFTPIVLNDNRISLNVSVEVSELGTNTLSSGFLNDGGSGGTAISIPSFDTRKVTTTVEMPSGRSFVIAGLMKEETRKAIDTVPGLKDIKILGKLFQSKDFKNNQTELVVIVTPYLVNPVHPKDIAVPGEDFIAKSQKISELGDLQNTYLSPGNNLEGQNLTGNYGFIIE